MTIEITDQELIRRLDAYGMAQGVSGEDMAELIIRAEVWPESVEAGANEKEGKT